MDIFKLRQGDQGHFHISEEVYFTQTQRRLPYSTKARSGEPLYLAVCPDCENPIEIREIDRIRGDNARHPKEPFGKHYIYIVQGLVDVIDNARYQNCSLRGEVSIGNVEHRLNDKFNHEILQLLIAHASVIRRLLAKITGIKIGPKLFEHLIFKFVSEQRFKCKGVIPSNLPFAIIYWAESQNLFSQYIEDTDLIAAINNSGLYCISVDGQVKPVPPKTKSNNYRVRDELNFHIPSYRKGNPEKGELNRMTLKVTQHPQGVAIGDTIFTKDLFYSNSEFFDTINTDSLCIQEKTAAERKKWSGIVLPIVQTCVPTYCA